MNQNQLNNANTPRACAAVTDNAGEPLTVGDEIDVVFSCAKVRRVITGQSADGYVLLGEGCGITPQFAGKWAMKVTPNASNTMKQNINEPQAGSEPNEKSGPTEKTTAGVLLDPATCLALKPTAAPYTALEWKSHEENPPTAPGTSFSVDVMIQSLAGCYVGYLDTESGRWHESYSGDAVSSQFTPRCWALLPDKLQSSMAPIFP